jgi:hypothetical protein
MSVKSRVLLLLFVLVALTHVVLTNLPGEGYAVTKVLLMPAVMLFFSVTVPDFKKGLPIIWTLAGLWLGNICLIWGDSVYVLYVLGSAATIAGLAGYVYVFWRSFELPGKLFPLLELRLIWFAGFFMLFMKDDLGSKLVPVSAYMTLILLISMLGLAQLTTARRSLGSWMMFAGTLFYIAENGLYTADHYMANYHFGVNVIHPCFIMAQSLISGGFLVREFERNMEDGAARRGL